MARLDYFIIANSLSGLVDSVDIYPGYRSDHSLITMSLNFQMFDRGPGFWKCNTSLLFKEAYVDKLKIAVNESIENSQALTPDKIGKT